ncbi:tetratricopeptide repeat protein, partial [Pseudomonas sp. AH2 (2023)]|uniref:tetratricopeptide repeat protein n=1 Tax=Pseudomonas sp. AH2 (2023) TaxID=3048599 RepID=UPI002B22E63B
MEAQTALAYSYHQMWHWADAEREFKRAIEIDPNYATAHHWYNLLLMETGRHHEGLAEIKLAQELDPVSLIIGYNLALN